MTPLIPAIALLACAALPVLADEAAPLLGPKPPFVPGQYEVESRNSHFQDQGVKAKVCIRSADFDAFRQDTIDQYLKSPTFVKGCALSQSRPLADGFAMAMDCKGTRIILTYHFKADFVSGTITTEIAAAPQASSDILILMRRVGDCEGGLGGKAL